MKRNIYLYCFLQTFLFYVSCTQPAPGNNEIIFNKVQKASGKNLSSYHYIFILPSQGCNNCINSAERFLMNSDPTNSSHKILFVVTGHESIKSAKLRFGEKILSADNVYFDIKHEFDKPPFMADYPKLLYVENGKVSKIVDISPENSSSIYAELEKL